MKRHLNLTVLALVWTAAFPPCAYIMAHGVKTDAATQSSSKETNWTNQNTYSAKQQTAIDRHMQAWKEARVSCGY